MTGTSLLHRIAGPEAVIDDAVAELRERRLVSTMAVPTRPADPSRRPPTRGVVDSPALREGRPSVCDHGSMPGGLVIEWWQILYGAGLSALAAALFLAIAVRGRRPMVILAGAMAALVGPIAWNAILRAAHGDQFFTDAPIVVFPVSWQDVGSGVFALAAATLTYGLLLGAESTRRTTGYGLLVGLAALLVDIYLY